LSNLFTAEAGLEPPLEPGPEPPVIATAAPAPPPIRQTATTIVTIVRPRRDRPRPTAAS
jgi:hypothetical protein